MKTSIPALRSLIVLSIILSFPVATLRADLLVVAGDTGGNYDGILYRYDGSTGAAKESFYALNEGWYGLCRAPSGIGYVIGNTLGYGDLYGVDADGRLARTIFRAGPYGPGEIVIGPDGALYGLGYLNSDFSGEGIIRYDPSTGNASGVFVPKGAGGTAWLEKLAFGGDGNLYATSDKGVVRFNGSTGAFLDVFVPIGSNGLTNPSALAFGPDGNLYVASRSTNSVKRYHGANGASLGDFVGPNSGGLNQPVDLAYGPDGRLYVASFGSNQVLRYDATTGAFVSVFLTLAKGPRLIAFSGPPGPSETVWFDDALPPGAVGSGTGGDGWNWVSTATSGNTDAPVHGSLAHRSNTVVNNTPLHEHFFNFAQPFPVNAGDILFTYVYLPPNDSPLEVMLSWNDGSNWEHRVYWGMNLINAGVNGTDSRRFMGSISNSHVGRWVRLEVPAKSVGLEGKSLRGMSFSLYGGSATWDRTGKIAPASLNPPPPPPPPGDTVAPTVNLTAPTAGASVTGTINVTASASDNVGVASVQFQLDGAALGAPDTTAPYSVSWNTTTASNGSHQLTAVARDAAGNQTTSAVVTVTVANNSGGGGNVTTWFDDAAPAGATTGYGGSGPWTWTAGPPSPVSGSKVLRSTTDAGRHEYYFNWAWQNTLTLNAGDKFFLWVYLDPAQPTRELVLSFCSDNWEHRAYWGENLLRYATDGTPAQYRMGPLPAAGGWVRLEVPANVVNLVGHTLKGLSITLYNGAAWFDHAGKIAP